MSDARETDIVTLTEAEQVQLSLSIDGVIWRAEAVGSWTTLIAAVERIAAAREAVALADERMRLIAILASQAEHYTSTCTVSHGLMYAAEYIRQEADRG